jgi:hypothetical protein
MFPPHGKGETAPLITPKNSSKWRRFGISQPLQNKLPINQIPHKNRQKSHQSKVKFNEKSTN